MATTTLNKPEIQITSVYFNNNRTSVRFESYPKKLVYKGREYALVEV